MIFVSRLMLLLLPVALAACATVDDRSAQSPAPSLSPARRPVTVLISADGLRPASLHAGRTPHIDALADSGVGGTMRPSFPANTFPNHLTLVTGQTPDHHGIVDNAMRDPERPGVTWKIGDATVNRDPFWWSTATPIWITAERANIRTGTMFWPGSDAPFSDLRPSNWFTYDPAITSTQRVDAVLDWIRRPEASRPAFVTLYLDVIDKASHNQGYDSEAERAAIVQVDDAIARLREGLKAMGQPVNMVLVSDHGMAPVPPDHVRPIGDVVDPAIMESITQGPWLDIYPLPGKDAQVAANLLVSRPNIDCWRRQDIPVRYAYGRHRRVAPFICMAHLGWSFVEKPRAYTKGEHGFDPDEPSMRAVFIANGPAFNRRFSPPEGFPNVNVYGLLARLIGIPAQPNDGDPAVLDGLLAKP